MLRLMGLPHVARFPKATVTLREDALDILFDGAADATRIQIPLLHLGYVDDLEAVELRLLARLQELGYQVDYQKSSA